MKRASHKAAVETAKVIRVELKKTFPGVKFSVRCDRNIVRIEYEAGAKLSEVRELAQRFFNDQVFVYADQTVGGVEEAVESVEESVEAVEETQVKTNVFDFEVCEEGTGRYTHVLYSNADFVADEKATREIIKEAFGLIPLGAYSVDRRGKSRIGNFTVYAS